MTAFEYFSAVIAVILGLGVTHLLAQISFAAQHPLAIRLHWIPLVWVGIVFVSHFLAWWNIWELQDSLRFSFRVFLYMLVGPTALYLAARVIMPQCQSSETVDLERHYFAANRIFFSSIAAFIVWPTLLSLALPGELSYVGILGHALLLAPVVACGLTRNLWVHRTATILVGALFVAVTVSGLG